MTGPQIALLAVVGLIAYKAWQRKKIEVGLEDLGGGLSDTDIEGYVPPGGLTEFTGTGGASGARVHPVVSAKPSGLEGDQIMGVEAYKSTASIQAGVSDVVFAEPRAMLKGTTSTVVPSGTVHTASGVAK
jgi:hypothetical protein